jgi:hypothetical protein
MEEVLMKIRSVVTKALADAQAEDIPIHNNPRMLHRERSKRFVEKLSLWLLDLCDKSSAVASLSKHSDNYQENRDKFSVNELLFDIVIVEYDTVNSEGSNKELTFVRRGIWAVESELANNKREALFDFNKLVLSAAENKLFVGPRVHDEPDYLRVLGKAAQHCKGTVYIALIPHPREWPKRGSDDVVAWKFKSGWEPLN